MLGHPVEVQDIEFDGNERRGLIAHTDRGQVSLFDVVPKKPEIIETVNAYRAWANVELLVVKRPRSKSTGTPSPARSSASRFGSARYDIFFAMGTTSFAPSFVGISRRPHPFPTNDYTPASRLSLRFAVDYGPERMMERVTQSSLLRAAGSLALLGTLLGCGPDAEPDFEAPVPGTGGWMVEMSDPACVDNVYLDMDTHSRIDCSASNESTCADATTLSETTGTCNRFGAGVSACTMTTASHDCTVARCEGGESTICTGCAEGACVGCSTTRCATGACLEDASGCAPGG